MLATTLVAAAALVHTVSALPSANVNVASTLARRQLDSSDPVEQLAMILLSFGVSVSNLEPSDKCTPPCLTDWANGVSACSSDNQDDVKTNVECACTDSNVALLQKCTDCMGGDNAQIGPMFSKQCPIAVQALSASGGVSSQASNTRASASALPAATSTESAASSVVFSASSNAAAATTSAVASHSSANGNASQPGQTGAPAPGSAGKAVASLLAVGAVGLAVLLI